MNFEQEDKIMKRVISTILVIAFTSTIVNFVEPAQAKYSGGSGEQNDPYQISTPDDIYYIGTHPADWGRYFIMTNDINALEYDQYIFNLIGQEQIKSAYGIDINDDIVYFADPAGKKICSINIDGTGLKDLIAGLEGPSDIAIDSAEEKLYWSDSSDGKIRKANMDGTAVEVIITEDFYYPKSVAFDSVHQKVYWASNTIKRANPDGSEIENLGLSTVSNADIALDLINDKLYFSDWWATSIRRANLDGSFPEIVVQSITNPAGISLDLINNKLYWVNNRLFSDIKKIQRSNLDGNNIEDIVTDGFDCCQHVLVDNNSGRIFWTDMKYIASGDLNGGNRKYVISNFFSGVFDGNEHIITHLTYNGYDMKRVGLFCSVADVNAVIKNLTILEPNIIIQGPNSIGCSPLVGALYSGSILNCSVIGGQVKGVVSTAGITGQSGAITGQFRGLISNCQSTCSVYGEKQTGGLVGCNLAGTISNCYFTGQVKAIDDHTGGLAGINSEGTIIDSFFYGSVVSAIGDTGGLVGYCDFGKIIKCHAVGSISSNLKVGGLVGYNPGGEIYDSYAICDVNASIKEAGGLVGYCWSSKIERCFADCNITGNNEVGGLCGYTYGTQIKNSYASGSATGVSIVGGLVGNNNNTGPLTNCYSSTSVTGESDTGGLVGLGIASHTTNCYWDIESSGQSYSVGGTGKTTAEMKTESTFTDAGWDFVWETVNGTDYIWAICEDVSYPKLSWQFIPGDFDNNKGVDFSDFAILAGKWMQADSTLYCGGTDLTGDGFVDLDGLDAFVENWLLGL